MAKRKRTRASIKLRAIRQKYGLTLREVQSCSLAMAKELKRHEFVVPSSRLHDFEMRGVVPSIFRIYTLARVYHCKVSTIMSWYGVPKR